MVSGCMAWGRGFRACTRFPMPEALQNHSPVSTFTYIHIQKGICIYIYIYIHIYIYILYSEFILICGLHIYSFHEGIRRKVFFLTLAVPRGLCYRWLSRFSCKHCKLQHLLLLCIKLLGNSNLQGPVLPQAIGG